MYGGVFSSKATNPADFSSPIFSSLLNGRGAGGTFKFSPTVKPFISSALELGSGGPLRTIILGVSSAGVRTFIPGPGEASGRGAIAGGTFAVGDTSIPPFGRALVAINWPRPLLDTMKVQYSSEE